MAQSGRAGHRARGVRHSGLGVPESMPGPALLPPRLLRNRPIRRTNGLGFSRARMRGQSHGAALVFGKENRHLLGWWGCRRGARNSVSVAENTAGKQRGRPFAVGVSGNPAGRPRGARNRTTVAVEEILDGEADALARKAIELALDGDTVALRLCLERIAPARKERASPFTLPELQTAADAVRASAALVQAVAAGELTTGQAAELSKLVESYVKTIEVADLEQRIIALEGNLRS